MVGHQTSVTLPSLGWTWVRSGTLITMLIDIHTHNNKAEPDVFRLYSTSDWKSVLNTRFVSCQGVGLSLGVHPWDAFSLKDVDKEAISRVLHLSEVMMVGEIGLDKVCHVPLNVQQSMFQFQLEVADSSKKPVVLHVVKAMAEVLAMRKTVKNIPAWILHGFRGGQQEAAQYLSAGFHLSFGKYHNETSLRLCPADRLFLETDENGDIQTLYEVAASVRGISFEALESSIEQNFRTLFPTTPTLLC